MSIILLLLGILFGYRMSKIFYKRQFEQAQATYNKILKKNNKSIVRKLEHHKQKLEILFSEYDRLKNIVQQKYRQNIQSIKEENTYLIKELEEKKIFIEKQYSDVEKKSSAVNNLLERLQEKNKALQNLDLKYIRVLVEKWNIDTANMKKRILNDIEQKIIHEKEILLNKQSNYMLVYSENMAKRLLSSILQRFNLGHWSESYPNIVYYEDFSFLSSLLEKVDVDNSLFRSLEVTIEINEESNTIFLHGSDGYSREVARRVLHQLITQNINDQKQVEEICKKIYTSIEHETEIEVQNICKEIQISPLAANLSSNMARLKYRTSFGQNILAHSKEVAIISTLLAIELSYSPELAKRSGFLHDIGKAVDHKESGGHSSIGKTLLESAKEKEEVIEGVVEHHEDVSIEKPYAGIVNIADAISASRPGARRETIEKYLKKLSKLETIAKNMDGVSDAYAVSAGKEVRVIVDPDCTDDRVKTIAKKMAQTIEKELLYSGVVKIIVIREKIFEAYS